MTDRRTTKQQHSTKYNNQQSTINNYHLAIGQNRETKNADHRKVKSRFVYVVLICFVKSAHYLNPHTPPHISITLIPFCFKRFYVKSDIITPNATGL